MLGKRHKLGTSNKVIESRFKLIIVEIFTKTNCQGFICVALSAQRQLSTCFCLFVAEAYMSDEDDRMAEPVRSNIHLIAIKSRVGADVARLRELAVRGLQNPKSLSPDEIKRVCIEVEARLARRGAQSTKSKHNERWFR